MSKSKIVALIIIVALIGGIVAYVLISNYTTLSDGDKGARIPVRLASYPESFDPATQQYDEDTMQFYSLIYSGLTRINSEGEVEGLLAEEWYGEYNERDDVYRITFELKETYWNDGTRVQADDVVFAWKRILSPEVESPYASMLYPIKNAAEVKAGIMTSDDLKIAAVNWNKLEIDIDPRCYTESYAEANGEFDPDLFARIVASPAFTPLKEDAVTRSEEWDTKATDIRTNGPFKVSTMKEKQEIVLERNMFFMRNPQDADDIPLDKYVLPHKLVCYYGKADETGTSVTEYTVDDFISLYDNDNLFYLGTIDKTTYEKYSPETVNIMSTYALLFNTKKDALADAEVRKALSAVLDRNEIVNLIGTGQVAATGVVPHDVFYTDVENKYRDKAGDKISTSADTSNASVLNGNGKTIKFLYLYTKGDDSGETVANYVKSVWEQYGYAVQLDSKPADFFSAVLSNNPEKHQVIHDYDVVAIDLAMHCTDPLAYLAQFSSICSGAYISVDDEDGKVAHWTGIEDEDFDSLVKEAIYCGSTEKRAELAVAVEEKLLDLCPVAPLYFSTYSYVASEKLTEFENIYGGCKDFNRAELEGYLERNASEDALSQAAEAKADE